MHIFVRTVLSVLKLQMGVPDAILNCILREKS